MNQSAEEEKHMLDEKVDHPEDPKGASRRSRKDEHGRDYVCGCGKRYLSYPALYTHIKTKHDGHQPEGTQKTGITPTTSRKTKQRIDEKVLREILNLVQLEKITTLHLLNENAMGYVNLNERIRKEQLGKELFEAFLSISKMSSLNFDSRSSLEFTLVMYLLGVGQYTSWAMYQYYCQFAKLFRNCFYENAQEVYTLCFRNIDTRKNKGINIEECKLVPIICDFFLRLFIVSENSNPDFLGVMRSICHDFCRWLFVNKLTIVEISLNDENFELRKDLVEARSKEKKDDSENGDHDEKEDKDISEDHHSSINESYLEKKDSEKLQLEEKIETIKEVEPEELQDEEESEEKIKQNSEIILKCEP